jgi:hypothetical protein
MLSGKKLLPSLWELKRRIWLFRELWQAMYLLALEAATLHSA